MGLRGLPKEELPKSRDILPKIYLIIPLAVSYTHLTSVEMIPR